MSEELEEIKQRKMLEMQKQQFQRQFQEQAQLQKQIEQLEALIKTKLTKEAISRYGNIKSAHPELAVQLLVILAQLIQTQPIESIDDDELRQILQKISPEKKEMRITYK